MAKVYKRGQTFYYSFTVGGRRVRASTGTSDRASAIAIAAELEARERRAIVFGPESVVSFADGAADYLANGGQARYLEKIVAYFGDMLCTNITGQMIRQGASAVYPHVANATKNRQFVTPARAVINHVADKIGAPRVAVKSFPVERTERAAGDAAWCAAFVDHAHMLASEYASAGDDARAATLHRLAVLALYLFNTGDRIGSAVTLTWEALSLADGVAQITSRKNGPSGPQLRTWQQPLPSTLVAAIANMPRANSRHVFGFGTRHQADHWWHKVTAQMQASGWPRLTTHEAGRHAFGTELMVRQGMDATSAAQLGRWQSTRMLHERYAHADKGEAQRQAIEKIFGGQGK